MADFDNIQWEDVKTDAELPEPEFIGGEIKEEDLAGIQWEDVNPMTQSVMDDRDQKVYNVPVSMDGIDATYAIDTQHRGADASNYFGKVEIVDKAAQSYLDNLKNSANPILALAGKVAEPVSEAGFAMQDANNPLKSIGRGVLEPVDLVEDWAYSNIAKRKIKTEIESRQLKEGKISWWDVALRPDWLPNESVADELAAEMKKFRQGLKDIQAERKNKILPQEQMNEADQVIEGMFGALSQTGLSLGSVFVSGNPYAASALIAGMYGQVKKEDVWEEAINQGVNPFAAEVMGNISSIYEAGIEFAGDLVGAKFAKVMPIRNLASQTMQKAAIRLAQKAQAAGADGVIKSASKHLDSIIAGTLKGAAGEYGEEVLQNFGGDLLTNIYGLTQIDLGESFENANIAGLYAAFAGGVAGGGGTAVHNRLAKKVNNKLIDTIKQTNPEIKEEEAQIIADGLQEVFFQEDAPEYAKELNKLNSKQIALMKEDKGLSEKNFAAETRKMLKEKYDMTDEQIDQTIKIGVNMIDMRNQYSKAYNYMREELELAGRNSQLADSEARIFAARMSAFARAEGLNLDDLLKERGVKVAQMKFADFMNGKRGKDSKSEMISLADLQDLRNLKNTKQNSKERTSLLAFIKRKGGMRDSGGELKNMDVHKSYIGVINKNSKLGMDDMALAAWEAGYFEGQERPDINELLAAVKDELMGNPRYSSKDGYEKGQNREQELRELGKELEKIGVDYMNDSFAEINRKMREAMDEADRMRTQTNESEEYNSLNEDQQEQYAILRDRGATHREAMEAVRPSEDMPWFQKSLDIAKENQRLDDIYPEYEGETITINGQERTVYNSNGDRIAKSKEALENFYRWFGDSKVVDEQGRPLVVYHGTNKEFEVFSKGLLGKTTQAESAKKGFFFTDDTEVADSYADYAAIYQPINELLEKQRQAEKEGNWDLFDKLTIEIEEKNREISQTPANQRGKKVYAVYLKANNVMEYDAKDEYFSDIGEDINKVLDKARKDKKDGVIIKNLKDQPNVYDEKSANHFVVFESNQIKSTSNRGTFSESENIYYQSAWHGGRELEGGKFSLKYAGKQVGLAHGYGVYASAEVSPATGYRSMVDENITYKGKNIAEVERELRNAKENDKANIVLDFAYKQNKKELDREDYSEDTWKWFENEFLPNVESKGKLYEIDIPEDAQLIEEKKPFSEQTDTVKEAIKKLNNEDVNDILDDETTGEDIYGELVNYYSKQVNADDLESKTNEAQKLASQELEKVGVKGIAYYDNTDGRCFVIFNPADVKVIQKFYQGNQSQTGRGGVARGAYSNNIIYLFEHADASTVIHELGHYFLDDLQKYGKSEKSQQQLQAIYNYLGAKDGVITNEMHEYFADSFEVYLKEGKAPNSLLRGVFIKFKNWLRRIFSEVKRLEGVKLTDEMRKTFDEMLGGKSLDFAMQTASENMQLNAKSGYIPPSVADFAIELIRNGKMSRAQMDDILERLKTGDLARADVYKELKAIEAKDEQHGEQLDPFDKVKYKEALLKDNINKGKVLDKIETLMKWAQPRDINGRTVGRFPNKKMNDFFIEANRLMNLEKDEAKQRTAENKSTITAILESRELPNEKYSVLGMNFDKEADRPELLNALAIENRLLGVAAKNISLDNAIKLYNDLQDSYNEGRLTANVTGDLKRARKMKMREATIRVLLGDGKVNPKAEKSRVKQFLNRLGTSQMSWGGLMDILSMNDASRSGQSELSQMMDVFQEEQNNAQWVADDGEKFCKFFEAKLQGANNGTISVSKYINNELDKKTKLQWGKYSRTFTKDELIDIYMKSKDMETKEIMLHDEINGFDQGFLDLVNQNLTADDRAFADALFEFYNDNWAKINAFYEEKYGVTMPKNTYYSPRTMLREGISVSDGSPAFASSGFTKKRTAGKNASIDIQGAFKVWNNYVTNTNRWLAWSDKLMDINSVFGNREIKNIIANQWGDNMNSRIRGEIERMAGAKGDKFSAAFSSKLMTKIRGNYAKSVLALKPALMIKQLTSFPAYWNEMSFTDFAFGLADFFKHPKEAIEILGNTTLMKTRGTDIIRDFAEISKMDILKGKKGIKWSDAMMLNIKLGDRGAIYMGGWALYKSELKKNLAQGMSEEEAKAKALERFERVTDETQQSGRLSQQSYWQSNPALRMFTMFQSSQNQYLRKEINAVRGALTGRMDKAQAAKTLFIFHVLLPCLFQFASDGFDWDKEAQLRAAVLGSLNGVFVLNSLLTKIYDHTINQWIFDEKPQYGSGRLGVREIVPFWASVEDLAKQFEKLANDDVDLLDVARAFVDFDEFREGEGGKALSKITKAAGEISGLPLKYPLDVIKNFGNYAEEDKYRKELLLYLGWSPYALKENDNKIELLDF